jgi:PTH1 family peptidyl-tRNA hydrolase
LSCWLKEEIPVVNLKVEKCIEVIENFATIGVDRAMNTINSLTFSSDEGV